MPKKSKSEPRIWKTAEVFVAGDVPTVTYNPRDDLHLEQEVRDYRDQPGKALSVSGPSKSGKTVLIERLFPKTSAIWVQGSDLSSVDRLWQRLADGLNAFDEISVREEHAQGSSGEGGLSLGVPKVVGGDVRKGKSSLSTTGTDASRTRPLADLVRETLDQRAWPIVVDDFQYVPTQVRRAVARAIKTLIPGTRVILIAVPHEAFEPVRAEPDMDGRVWQLTVEHWSQKELMFIAREGFEALRIVDRNNEVAKLLADASYGAPFLMQQLCHDYALAIGVKKRGDTDANAVEPGDWGTFFKKVASRTQPGVFEKLLRGPDPRGTSRTPRKFKVVDVTTDIYGAVLYGMVKVGLDKAIRYQDIVRVLEDSFDEPPRSNQVTNALRHMRDIAFESRGASDPALDFKNGVVHIMDPFLAFYLEHGPWIK